MILTITTVDELRTINTNNVNEQDPSTGNTILHKAFIKNFSRELKIALLDLKIDTNIKNSLGQTPIYYAKSIDDVKLLLKYGALITIIDIYGKRSYDSNKFVKELMTQNVNLFN